MASVADMVPYLSAAAASSSSSNDDVASSPLSASSPAVLLPAHIEVNFDEWVQVKSSMSAEQIEEARASVASSSSLTSSAIASSSSPAALLPASSIVADEAVAQCSMAALTELLASLDDAKVAEVVVYDNADDALESPKTISLDELRQSISSL
jgi:hypothetical protein